ncbi:T6SS effector BTH_I2691 family protein [Xenorhabdus szentirmaii]|uniref:T6SS effector BTH_I2691 family protein n=1 Tax=Xenorhabdus szentirmaii TaxID=290112 RepID=UPI001996954C|nr:T6SS effector BTH_I2691 family protein [Xenorhabdus sp. 38]MBD2781761.1 hypothetical protein [Xenorhabdus sp. 38]
MSTELGCGFCQREGLPVFLARPAIMDKSDPLPTLKGDIDIPVKAEGEVDYTARTLREGFLYVYSEKFNFWETYTISSNGYYYLQPEGICAPQCLDSEKKTLCMSNTAKLAKASFITLSNVSDKQENGTVWFAWSDAPWSKEMKKQHENKEVRKKNMEPFDVDVWLKNGRHKNAKSLNELKDTVSEYNENLSEIIYHKKKLSPSTPVEEFSEIYFNYIGGFELTPLEKKARNIIYEANQLSPNKGVILLLSDPVGVVKDISWFCNYLINKNFENNEEYTRELALSSMLSSLKEAVCGQYRKQLQDEDIKYENDSIYAAGSRGALALAWDNIQKNKDEAIKTLDSRVEALWEKQFEKYIDRNQEKYFFKKYDGALFLYKKEIIFPMVNMYLKWLDSGVIKSKFLYNYDQANEICSLLYVQAVNDCVEGMTDNDEVIKYLVDKISQEIVSENNFILRAMFKNDEKLFNKVNEGITNLKKNKEIDYASLPWNKIFDGVTDSISQFVALVEKLEVYLSNISNALVKVVDKGINELPRPAIIALALSNGKAVVVVSYTGEYKHFIRAGVMQSAKMLNINSRSGRDYLYHLMEREVRKQELAGVKINENGKVNYFLTLDEEEANKLRTLPKEERGKNLNRVLLSEEKLRKEVFEQHENKINSIKSNYNDKVKATQDYYKSEPVSSKIKNTQLGGCTASFLFQLFALGATWKDSTKNTENRDRYYANLAGIFGTAADGIDRLLYKYKNRRFVASLGNEIRLAKYSSYLQVGVKVFSLAAAVGVYYDTLHGFEEYGKKDKNKKLITAYGVSAGASFLLILYTIGWLTFLGPFAIIFLTAALFGSANYINSEKKDDIQNWLLACMWRKIPVGEKGIPPMWATKKQEEEAFLSLM